MVDRFRSFEEFDPSALEDALDTETRTTRDVAHGLGEAMTLAESMTELQVYPAAGVVRATSEAAQIEVHRVPGYTVQDCGSVVFEPNADTERTSLTVNRTGTISLQSLDRAPAAQGDTAAPVIPIEKASPQNASDGATESTQPAEQGELQPATLVGRLGRDPWFAEPDGEELRGGFPLAVNHNDGKPTTWHTVFSESGEVAQVMRDGKDSGFLKRGRMVEVTGHPPQDEPGQKKQRNVFIATSIARVKAIPASTTGRQRSR